MENKILHNFNEYYYLYAVYLVISKMNKLLNLLLLNFTIYVHMFIRIIVLNYFLLQY